MSVPAPAAPAVTVVIATYNRPEVLTFTIRSVLAQTVADWELIVVGDGCAEPTAAAVTAFGDPRIRYVNLDRNCGDQSGPNTAGVGLARGRHVAFLNHDDIWFPDHLATALALLARTSAVVAIGGSASVSPSADPASGDWTVTTDGIGFAGAYDPVQTIGPASCLVLTTAAAQAAGPWRPASECFAASSQAWLFGLWRRGFDVRTTESVSVLRFRSGRRPNAYRTPDTPEHAYFEPLMMWPDRLRIRLHERLAAPARRSPGRRLAHAALCGLLYLGARIGLPPTEMHARFVLGYRRGQYIKGLRQTRGLPV